MTRKHAYALIAIAVVPALYVLWTGLVIGGTAVTIAIEDYGQAAAAGAAAVACGLAARRGSGGVRWGWLLLGASAACWAAGEIYWAVDEANLGVVVPFPSAADLGFLGSVPLAAAALLLLPFGPPSARSRVHAVLDGLIVAISVSFVAWAVGLGSLESESRLGLLGGLLVVAYPAGDVVLLTLLAMRGARTRGRLHGLLLLLMAAYAGNLLADTGFAFLRLRGEYGALGSFTDAGWIAGFLLLGFAATWPVGAVEEASHEETPEMWELLMPWIGVVSVLAVSGWLAATGRQVGTMTTWLGSLMGVVFLASQFLALQDGMRLIVSSRRTASELYERTAMLAEVIGRAPLGIARLSRDLRFIEANPRLAEMLGVPAQALIGSAFEHYLAADDTTEIRTRAASMAAGRLAHAEVDDGMRCADGRTIWVHRSVTPVLAASGELQYFLVMFEDITSKHQTEEAERANLVELERINRLKSEFMSMVSHEFRTALTGIQGYSEVLMTEDVGRDEVKEFSRDINSESLRLNRMITEMLDLDRIESGRIQIHPERIDLNVVISDATDRARMATDRHEFALQLDPLLPQVEADRDRITQVVANLLSNAVKYSPEGGRIEVASRAFDGNVEVTVRDHGQGIPPEFIPRIFGRYERYEQPGRPQVVGTGLGLAISQQIVQLHKGRIWVESELGVGSSFRFTLPLPAAAPAAAPEPAAPAKVA